MDGSSVLRTDSNKKNHHLLVISLNSSHFVDGSTSWIFVVAWEHCLFVDEHVLDVIL